MGTKKRRRVVVICMEQTTVDEKPKRILIALLSHASHGMKIRLERERLSERLLITLEEFLSLLSLFFFPVLTHPPHLRH